MSLVLVNGVHLRVEVEGRGPALVALHGFTGDMSTWDLLGREARDAYTVVRVDLIGHGGSDAPAQADRYAIERSVADLTGILDHLGIDSAAWLGYSMGGRIALMAAVLAPGRCSCLVLEGGSPGLSDPAEREARTRSDAQLADMVQREGIASFIEHWQRMPLFESQARLSEEARELLHRQRVRNRSIGIANTLLAAGPGVQAPLWDRLPSVSVPSLCIAGADDTKFCRLAMQMARAMPHGVHSTIPQAGHAAHLEQPDAFYRLLLEFLGQALKGRKS